MDNKTEKATPKKRKDERKKGNVFQSKEIVTVAALLAGFLFLSKQIPNMGQKISEFSIKYFSYADDIKSIGSEEIKTIFLDMLQICFSLVLPISLIIISTVIAITFAQTRFLFSNESLKFKFSKLNPISGIKRLFSLKSLVEVVKSLFKIILFIACFYYFISSQIKLLAKIQSLNVASLVSYIITSAQSLVWLLLVVFIVIAVFDFAFQKWEYEKNIRMSKQEIKQEYKEQEGDPQVKAKIKDLQRKMSSGRMMEKVPEADVIIRNPTHYAVALKFDMNRKIAPVVIAKGMDDIALKIIEIAQIHDIPMTENIELARALYAEVDIDCVIPKEYYSPVAKVLAWVYSIKKKG